MIPINILHFSVGFGFAYPRLVGITRALMHGIGNGSDSRASFLYVFNSFNLVNGWRFGNRRFFKTMIYITYNLTNLTIKK